MPQATLRPRRGLWARLEAFTDSSDQPTGRPELRDQLWWPATRRRWAITAVVGVVVILAAFALANWVADPEGLEQWCKDNQARCGLASNFVVALVFIVLGSLYIFYVVRRRAVRKYIRTARDRPHRLLPAPPHGLLTGTTVSRDDVCRLVARPLRHASGAGAQIVVGEAGSGKTTFLRELASYLADRGAVPVVVPLRGVQPPLSFPVLARQRFFEAIDADVRTEDEADRIWRTLRKEGSIVVLADGLDEVIPEMSMNHRADVVRRALNEARYQELPLVVTCRTGAMPLKGSYAEVELRPLTPEEARTYIERRVAGGTPEPQEHELAKRDEILDVKGVGDTPFYLNIVAELLRVHRLADVAVPWVDGQRRRDDLRIQLLDTFTQVLADGTIPPISPLQLTAREVIDELARIAGAMTFRGVLEITEPALREACQELSTRADPLAHNLAAVPEDGTRLGLMQTLVGGGETTIRFTHAILQAYFTERLLTEEARRPFLARRLTGNGVLGRLATRCGWRQHSIATTLIERTASNELLQALTIWCDKTGDGGRKRVAAELRGRAGARRGDAALRLVVTGMEILGPLGDDVVRKAFEQAVDPALNGSGQTAKLAAIERLGELGLPCAYKPLLRLGRDADEDHGVRLQAARAIAAGGETAYLTVREQLLGRDLAQVAAEANQGNETAIRDLTVLGWVLPSLSTGTRESQLADETRAHVQMLAGLVCNRVHLDLEASIARGFKLDALVNPEQPVDDLAVDLLGQFTFGQFKTRFWFSRILLLQALCVRTAGNPRNHEVMKCFRDVKTRPREHPFVRETARLCREAVRKRSWEGYVWSDEGEAVAGSGGILDPAATELLADVALLLNLMKHGDRAEHLARVRRSNELRDLPFCMSESRTREEFTTFCKGKLCGHNLCPYPDRLDGKGGMGPLSEAFCRHQSSHRSRGRPVHRRLHRSGVRRMSRRASRQFWDQMAERGRT